MFHEVPSVARSDRRSQHITIAKPWAYATGRQFEAGVWFSFRSARPAALLVAEPNTRCPVIVASWLRVRQRHSYSELPLMKILPGERVACSALPLSLGKSKVENAMARASTGVIRIAITATTRPPVTLRC
jgi:hypothetical protein